MIHARVEAAKNIRSVMGHNMKVLTLVFITKGDEVLLGLKKRGFGSDYWNGFGGKVEPGEEIETAARRELREESGLEVGSLKKFAVVIFNFESNPVPWEIHFFRTENFIGEPLETEEMRPQWFDKNNVPFESMWADDFYWWPHFLANDKFRAEFWLDKDKKITSHMIEKVAEIV